LHSIRLGVRTRQGDMQPLILQLCRHLPQTREQVCEKLPIFFADVFCALPADGLEELRIFELTTACLRTLALAAPVEQPVVALAD
jgi:hypothetical protein